MRMETGEMSTTNGQVPRGTLRLTTTVNFRVVTPWITARRHWRMRAERTLRYRERTALMGEAGVDLFGHGYVGE